MRKRLALAIFIFTLIFVLALSGCKKEEVVEEPIPNSPITNEDPIEVEEDEKALIMEGFSDIVNGKDPLQIKEYVDSNIRKLSQLEGNEMIDKLEESLIDNLADVTDRLMGLDSDRELMGLASDEIFFPEDLVSEIKNEDLKREVATVFDSLYKLVNLEGNYYPIVDYAGLQDYNNYVTDEWKEYLAIKAMDSENPALADAALRISFSDLANRILKTENYLNKYLDSSRQEEMVDSYHHKINVYLKGVDNSPIADRATSMIAGEVFDSYVNTSHNEGYITANILFRYVEAIKDNGHRIDDKILELADELISEAVSILREYK